MPDDPARAIIDQLATALMDALPTLRRLAKIEQRTNDQRALHGYPLKETPDQAIYNAAGRALRAAAEFVQRPPSGG